MNQIDIIQAINDSPVIQSHTKAIIEIQEDIAGIQNRLDQMITRDEFFQAHDTVIKLLTKLDEERIFVIDWQRRQDEDITKLKFARQTI